MKIVSILAVLLCLGSLSWAEETKTETTVRRSGVLESTQTVNPTSAKAKEEGKTLSSKTKQGGKTPVSTETSNRNQLVKSLSTASGAAPQANAEGSNRNQLIRNVLFSGNKAAALAPNQSPKGSPKKIKCLVGNEQKSITAEECKAAGGKEITKAPKKPSPTNPSTQKT